MSGRVVVVGAGLGGLRTAERLRAGGWTEGITVIGAEPHLPYNRPPLTKEALQKGPSSAHVELRRRRSVDDVEWRLGRAASSVDLDGHEVRLEDGTTVAYDGLVVATGVRPRRLDLGPDARTQVLRTLDDAAALHDALRPGCEVVVLGAGFVGCEVAASATAMGARVSIVDPGSTPLELQAGRLLGAELGRRHEEAGVRLHLGRRAAGVERTVDDRRRVRLDDGTELVADVLVEAVGSVPVTAPLAGQGLDLCDGVLCDEGLHPLRDDRPVLDAVVVGDVARAPLAGLGGGPRRFEHWGHAVDTAAHAATSLLAGLDGQRHPDPLRVVPAFWSEQHGTRLQSFGVPAAGLADVRLLEGDLTDQAALGYHDEQGLVGVILVGLTARMMELREAVAAAWAARDGR